MTGRTGKNKTMIGRLLGLAALLSCTSGRTASPAERQSGEGPREQFQSVIYVRGVRPYTEARDLYLKLRPHSLMSAQFSADPQEAQAQVAEARAWGCRYLYEWFNATWCQDRTGAPPDPTNPTADVGMLHRGVWENWDQFRAAGVVTGKRPAQFEDLIFMSREYAEAMRAGKKSEEMPKRIQVLNPQSGYQLCLANPDVRRIMSDLTKFRAAHGFGRHFNAFMCDLGGGTRGGMDYSPHSARAFDAWLRERYTPEQIRANMQTDPAQPVPLLPPKDDPDLVRVYNCLTRQFFTHVLAEHFRALKEAAESVLGKGNGGFLVNANTFGWRSQTNLGVNPAMWGEAVQTYCSEAGIWPGMGGVGSYVGLRLPDIRNNLFDFQYGAGRLWGEPVMVKAYFYDARNPATAQLGLAEGLALLGNMGLYVHPQEVCNKVVIPGAWVLPMAEFTQEVTPQIRQMIPAGEVGVLFSPVDYFCGFDENYRQAYELCDLLQRQHVPFQLVHLNLLERVLRERPLRAIIVPWLRCVSDAEVAVLSDFARAGGGIVFIGECGTYTGEGIARKASAFLPLTAVHKQSAGPLRAQVVGAGRVAEIPPPVQLASTDIRSHAELQQTLAEVLGTSPSVVAPDRHPALLANLTRNSNNSRFWLHLLNYDVNLDAPKEALDAVRRVEALRVVVPLPRGLRAARATLQRPGLPAESLALVHGREGCAVLVPWLDIYALIEVATERGDRPARPLGEEVDPHAAAVANLRGTAAARKLVPPPGPLPKNTPRGQPQSFVIGSLAYLATGPEKEIRMRVKISVGSFPLAYTVYDFQGQAVASGVVTGEAVEKVSVPTPGLYAVDMRAGMKRHGVIGDGNSAWTVEFLQPGGAVFEASQAVPLEIRKEKQEDAPAIYYFYVPRGRTAFNIVCDTTDGTGVRLIVKDPTGAVVLDQSGKMTRSKPFEVKVPEGAAGKVWSLVLDDPPEGRRKYSTVYLEGVPPVVAEIPEQLLIAQGDE